MVTILVGTQFSSEKMSYKGLPGMTKRQRISYHCRLGKYKDRESSDESECADECIAFEDKDQLLAMIQKISTIHSEQVTELQTSQWDELKKVYDQQVVTIANIDKCNINLTNMKNKHNKELLLLLSKQQAERDPVIDQIAVYKYLENN